MSETQKRDQPPVGRKDEATDPRTLDEIEEEERVPSDLNRSPVPSPDEGSGRRSDNDAGGPM
jgi:hypothetical protein